MDRLFITILNMSLTGAFVVAAICIARLSLKKAPKIISYCLWAVAGFRLALPFTIESVFSLIPIRANTIPPDIATQSVTRIDSGISIVNDAVSSVLSSSPGNMAASTNPLQLWTTIGSKVWLAGAAVMLVFGVASYIRLRFQLRSAIRVEGNIYETDGIRSPFVSGVLKPKIYIPLNLSGPEYEYIILHERTHIRRHDHIIKFAAYFILCLHWFNPLTWAAFLLMGVDMEMSCDERVLKELGGEIKKDYSLSLLSLAVGRRVVRGSPLAFGEDGVKKRIKNVLKFRKSSRIAVVLAIVFVSALSLGLMVSRAASGDVYAPQATDAETESIDSDNGSAVNNDSDDSEIAYVSEVADESELAYGYEDTNRTDAVNRTYIDSISDAADGSEAVSLTEVANTNSEISANAKNTYIITDYYNNEDGKFSARGLALDESDSERVLMVESGDILIAGDRRFEVEAESLTLSFNTQPTHEQVVLWWTDCLDSWVEHGKVTEVK